MSLIYFLTGGAFYWLAYRNAPRIEETRATHPAKPETEIIHLFPAETDLRAA